MMMHMLERGGLEVVTDGVRVADESNPRGYYEDERVKRLEIDSDRSWLMTARGRAIKIISFLLKDLPDTHQYRVIFMHRDLDEIVASQRKMLRAAGTPDDPTADERIAGAYRHHLAAVARLMPGRSCFDVLDVDYANVLDHAREEAERVEAFLTAGLDVSKMAAAVDRAR